MSSKTDALADPHPSSPSGSSALKLSVVMPVYNQRATIGASIYAVLAVPIAHELIVIDDGSDDGTQHILRDLKAHIEMRVPSFTFPNQGRTIQCANIRVLLQPRNRGKGAAIRRAFKEATGDVLLVQDGDFGLDPQDYPKLLAPIERETADVVYGSRFLAQSRGSLSIPDRAANKLLTGVSNLLTGMKLSDVWTGCKMFRREIIQAIPLHEDRFGFEPEITAKIGKRRCRVVEVPVCYVVRSPEERKKINWKDAFRGLWCTLRYGILN
jgi:glycosyltransferase involved in cell wall biosynthesis